MQTYVCACKRCAVVMCVFFLASHRHCIDGYRFYNSKAYEANSKSNKPVAAFAICIIHWLNEPRWRWWRQQSGDTIQNGKHISNDSVPYMENEHECVSHRGRAKLRNTVFRVHTHTHTLLHTNSKYVSISNVPNCLNKIATSTENMNWFSSVFGSKCVCVCDRAIKSKRQR